ncbi:tetratricopeptide repeat protein [Opitutia bacterium ISCC 51]|nr:tetratricopeptide repeat protein [Opitutae bacterium ISCC 51]QXD27918.1 tetratricopeptide repeat protein [Opitutae bacterium ISCC 52]
MKRVLLVACFLSQVWLTLFGQNQDPLMTPVPLVEEKDLGAERAGNLRLWQEAAADNALRSGLASIAIGLYDQLLVGADGEDPRTHEMELNRISSFIALGRMEDAEQALSSFQGNVDSRVTLRQALVSFFNSNFEDAEDGLEEITIEDLKEYDLAWYYLLLGLIEKRSENEEGDSLLNRARLLSVSPEQSSQVDLIIYRSLLLNGDILDEDDLEDLKTKMDEGLASNIRAGYQFTKEYVIALYLSDRFSEATQAITQTLPGISEANYDLRDELLLLLGIIAGYDSTIGADAFRDLVSVGVVTELRLRALRELVSVASSVEEIDYFLNFTDTLDQGQFPQELANQIFYNRAQLLYRKGDYEASGTDCEALLQRNPDVELRESATRLLVLIAFQRQRYRTASGLLIELSNLVVDPDEQNQLQLLVADCFFQAGDYGDAAESYGIAIQQVGANRGGILFQWVLSEIRAGNLEEAGRHMESFKTDGSLDPVQKWRALWNYLTALHSAGEQDKAFDVLNSWLTQDARDLLPVDLWIRLLWFRCQLSLQTGNYQATPILAGEVYAGLTAAEGAIDPATGIDVSTLTNILEGQALIFAGRQEEGLELMETVRSDYPSTRAAAQSYLAEARYYASQNLLVEAQRRYIELADNYPGSELTPVALYEAALNALNRGTDATRLEANQILNRLAEEHAEHPLVFYSRLHQGNLLRRFNDFGGAEVVYDRLLVDFPQHKDKHIVEMAQAKCILAQTDTSQARLDQAIGRFERLAELPELPIDLRVEASWMWAFSYDRRSNPDRVVEIYWLAINQFLLDADQSDLLGPTGRYWMSKIVISLGEVLEEQGDVDAARRVYSYIQEFGLPFNSLAEGKLSRLAQKRVK